MVEAGIRERPLDDRRREWDTSPFGQRSHIQRVAGDDEAYAPQVARDGVVATQEQQSPAGRQVFGQGETRDGHVVNHAGYDSEQECQEPT